MYILLMYYISLLLLPPDGFLLCYFGLLVLTLWRFGDDIILPKLQKFRPQNLRHTWTEEHLGTSSQHTSSSHPSGPCPLMCPEHRCQRSGLAPQGWLTLT